jgi:hypothetical protein
MREDNTYRPITAEATQHGPLTKLKFWIRGIRYEMVIDENQLYQLMRRENRSIRHILVEDYDD